MGCLFFFLFLTSTATFSYGQGIIKPCVLSDYKCITNILSSNSECEKRVWGSVPEQITLINRNIQIPNSNTTWQDQYLTLRNINNCYVSAFFLNPALDVAVLGIDCPDIYYESNRAIVLRQPNDQNRYYSARIQAQYPLIHFTLNLRHATEIDLCNTYVSSYITAPPKYTTIPNNELTQAFVDTDANGQIKNIRTTVREEFLNRGTPIARIFINYMLCNFGCFT